jgi:NADPH-dependent 7-cyano-7-deazaguanine reductase QueF
MTEPTVVPCDSNVTVTISGPIRHLCPHVDEVDNGVVEITWTTGGWTLELHSVRTWLGTYADRVISHEDLTEELRVTLAAIDVLTDVHVSTRWETAGLAVAVTSEERLGQ